MKDSKKSKQKKDVNRTRNKSFNLRFSEKEFEELNEKIKKSKLNRTDFILKCIENKDIIVIENLTKTIVEIRKQGVNINQIARAINEYVIGLEQKRFIPWGLKNNIETFISILYEVKESNRQIIDTLNEILEKELK